MAGITLLCGIQTNAAPDRDNNAGQRETVADAH